LAKQPCHSSSTRSRNFSCITDLVSSITCSCSVWILLSQVEIPAFAWLFAALVSAALLIQLAKEQLAQRQLAQAIQWVIIVAAIAVWAAPQLSSIFNLLLIVWGLIVCLIYAIFAGWIMKISHLRKSMGFSNELFYNLWRIAVRLVLPLSIVIAIVAVIGQWI
jgi:hypothetical protein